MKQTLFTAIAAIIIFQSPLLAQEQSVLAEVGNEEISAKEFVERFQLTPQVHNKKITGKKEEMLYALISEKLWAQRALELGLDTSDIMKYTYKTVEKMYVRDALFNRDIKSQVDIDPDRYQKALERSRYTLKVDVLMSGTLSQINKVYDELKKGKPFSVVAVKYQPAGLLNDTLEINHGDTKPSLEDSLYTLEKGESTVPIKSDKGWAVFTLIDKEEKKLNSKEELETYRKNVKDKVEQKATNKLLKKYTAEFFGGNKVNANGHIFWSFANSLIERIKFKKDSLGMAPNEKYVLDASDIKKVEFDLGPDTLQMTFIEFKDEPVTTKKFLREFLFEGFYTRANDPDIIRGQLKSRVKRFIEREMLVREAYKRGLDDMEEVKESIDMWRDSYLAKMMKNRFYDSASVTDEEAREYFQNKEKNEEFVKKVNIVEILTDNLETVQKIFKELDEGTDFRELAAEYTQREWTKEKGGEFGFFPVTEHGEIGRTAADMEVGEIFGPLEVPEGYSIFKLIDKKKESEKLPDSFAEAKSTIKEKLRREKVKDMMVEKTIKLANKYGVSVDKNLLNSIPVKNYNMLVYRYMGFGGRIPAVPQTIPFTEWIKHWEKSDKVLP